MGIFEDAVKRFREKNGLESEPKKKTRRGRKKGSKRQRWSSYWDGDVLELGKRAGPDRDSPLYLMRLQAHRRAMGNFVNILTGKRIPVVYPGGGKSYTTGEVVVIGSSVDEQSFDSTVGLALHEGSHCAYTDFATMQDFQRYPHIYLGQDVYNLLVSKNFPRDYIVRILHDVWNFVEDRWIDARTYRDAPGYRPYYVALYDRYFNADVVTKALRSDKFRVETVSSYMFRLINITNPATDLDALARLQEIWNILDLQNILRLDSTRECVAVAAEVVKVIAEAVPALTVEQSSDPPDYFGGFDQYPDEIIEVEVSKPGEDDTSDSDESEETDSEGSCGAGTAADSDDNNSDTENDDSTSDEDGNEAGGDNDSDDDEDADGGADSGDSDSDSDGKSSPSGGSEDDDSNEDGSEGSTGSFESDENEQTDGDAVGDSDSDGESSDSDSDGQVSSADGDTDSEDSEETSKDPYEELTEQEEKKLQKALKKQEQLLRGETKKKGVTKKQQKKMYAISESGMEMKRVGKASEQQVSDEDVTATTVDGFGDRGWDAYIVKKLTDGLIVTGTVPMIKPSKYASYDAVSIGGKKFNPDPASVKAVERGIAMGRSLVKRLQVRTDDRVTKYTRLKKGKIDPRLINELGYQSDAVFHEIRTDTYKDAILRISIDASSSMSGDKWIQAMAVAVAMAWVAKKIEGLAVVIDFRSTMTTGWTNRYGRRVHRKKTGKWVGGKWKADIDEYVHPYILVAFDSREDHFSKIQKYFPLMSTAGTTPEGLCFEAIMDHMEESGRDRDSYFLNLSDGCPYFDEYSGELAQQHTRKMVRQMRLRGITVMSYFITESANEAAVQAFRTMYGRDARFIDPQNITQIARTLNDMFLAEGKKTV